MWRGWGVVNPLKQKRCSLYYIHAMVSSMLPRPCTRLTGETVHARGKPRMQFVVKLSYIANSKAITFTRKRSRLKNVRLHLFSTQRVKGHLHEPGLMYNLSLFLDHRHLLLTGEVALA